MSRCCQNGLEASPGETFVTKGPMKRYEKVPFSECFKRDGKTTPFGETFQGHDLKLALT